MGKKKKRKFRLFHVALFGSVLAATLLIVASLSVEQELKKIEPQKMGVTYSVVFADQLGLHSDQVFAALMDEVGVKRFRLPVYWSMVEAEDNNYDWSRYDRLLDAAEQREGIEITLAIGRKVPRWPECFIPGWVFLLSDEKQDEALLDYMREAVNHFKGYDVITRWQVENEPFLAFGECPHPSLNLFREELNMVRMLDDRPIQVTTSGEQEPWLDTAMNADIVGVSLYRLVWSDFFGFAFYPFSPAYYRIKAAATSPFADEVIISELQAEPWFTEPIEQIPIEDQYKIFDVKALEGNLDFAKRTQLDEVYLWGAEWWYYMKENGDNRHWEAVKEIFSE